MDIQAEHIHLSFGKREILKDITLAAENKAFVGVLGPNGSGKSTLLKCIYRVLKPDEGVVWLDQRPLESYKPKESAQRMAVVAQHNFYNFSFTVQDIVLLGRSPHKKTLERDSARDYHITEEALKTVGMLDFKDRLFNTLSGGEQQRVILARALTQEPYCLILDEPTNHLDIKYQLELMDIVKDLGITVISAIHDLNIAAMYCDLIYAMKDGEIVACGPPEDVITEDFIWEVYGVKADVVKARDGFLRIFYWPGSGPC